ncbi:hypothetical protein DAI22_09g075650 [Oryza sativa Japonica Group]|nr:hypothetical protein DAI22_09g075650 [Oryza sativa Japonica Group]
MVAAAVGGWLWIWVCVWAKVGMVGGEVVEAVTLGAASTGSGAAWRQDGWSRAAPPRARHVLRRSTRVGGVHRCFRLAGDVAGCEVGTIPVFGVRCAAAALELARIFHGCRHRSIFIASTHGIVVATALPAICWRCSTRLDRCTYDAITTSLIPTLLLLLYICITITQWVPTCRVQ